MIQSYPGHYVSPGHNRKSYRMSSTMKLLQTSLLLFFFNTLKEYGFYAM